MIILAAGSSTRLGQPKQLLIYKGKTLIDHIVCEAVETRLHPIIVITGFNAERVSAGLATYAVNILYNEKWRDGMASGIVKGIKSISGDDLESVFITVCDQPFVSSGLFLQMLRKRKQSRKEVVACSYDGTCGVPALFGKNYFPALRMLNGQEGAKKIFALYESDLVTVPFENGSIDIDTVEDYKKLISLG
jgi:molybdenum cofactor cytidylyltransferase